MKRVTIKDIAKIAGVSCATISRALNDSTEINPETRERIREICQREGYHTNSLARSLVSNRTGVIGLILPDISKPFYSEVALDVEICARKRGYSVMMCNSLHRLDQTVELLQFLTSHQVDGIIIADSHDEIYQYITTDPPHIPIVLLGEFSGPDSACNIVSLDNYAAGKMAAEYLLNLGHRDIVYLGCQTNSTTHTRRYSGYAQTMKGHGLQPYALDIRTTGSALDSGAALTRELLDSGHPCSAIVASSDNLAMGVMKAARERNLQIPEDLSLIGVDNCAFSSLPGTMLTTIDQRKMQLAEASVSLLMELIQQEGSSEDYTHRILRPALVERSTCAVRT